MLRIVGSQTRLCDGIGRRTLLRAGGLGLAGLALDQILQLQAAAAEANVARPRSFGHAKHVILIHLYGSPSQLETFDPKPDAPVEVRGELGSIESRLPGCHVGELLPRTANVLDRCTVIRSMTHPYPTHGVAYALTGIPTITPPMELNPRDPGHWPYFGSVVDYVDAQQAKRGQGAQRPANVPNNVALPFRFSSRREGEVPRAGPYAAFLGAEYAPVWTDFVGTGTRGLDKKLGTQIYNQHDPYMGCSADSHFIVPSATSLQPELTLDRLNRRRSLVEQIDAHRGELARSAAGKQLDRYRDMTYRLLESDQLRGALDTRRESPQMREQYGNTLFGHACLTARRLVEAGSRVVSVFWDEYGLAGSAWDTHWNHYPRMKQELCPPFDAGFAALIDDLDQRGLLDETLVVCTSEHGRTTKVSNKQEGGGRDHWSRAYSTVLAGGGIVRGQVIGTTDAHAGEVVSRPVSPKDMQATMYHLLGIDHHTLLHDLSGRPLPLVDGRVLTDAIA